KYLEEQPGDDVAWRRLARLYRSSGDAEGELHALSEVARLSGARFEDLSAAAQAVNFHLAKSNLRLESDRRRRLVEPFVELMNSRLGEADAVDLSKMAWLSLHLRRPEQAARYARRGLELDPNNQHCAKLVDKLGGATGPRSARSSRRPVRG